MHSSSPALRVSFDVDDTLVCGAGVPSEQNVPFLYRRRYPEPVRRGSRALMRELGRRNCRVWLYTSSGRPAHYLEGWFRCQGIRLEGVVNQDRHHAVVGCRGPSKFPPAFNIHLHVDDSEGVAMEARTHGFHVCVVAPHDPAWAERVLAAVERLRAQ
jgi:FMN phosphatase YigB (HAD superfamily)